MCTQNPLHEDENGFDTCDGTCDYPPDDEDVTTEVPSIALTMQITRREGVITHLAVRGFPIEWSASEVVDVCRQAPRNQVSAAILEAVDAGHWQFPESTGAKDGWRLFVDNE